MSSGKAPVLEELYAEIVTLNQERNRHSAETV